MNWKTGELENRQTAKPKKQQTGHTMDDLYREVIIEHYKNPVYKGHLDPHDYAFEDSNPLCGDHIEITLRVDGNGKVAEAAFNGHGCAISQASADLLIESILGKPVEDIKSLNKEHILDLLGIELGPVRLKCALLSLKVLKGGLYGLGDTLEEA
ncbi:MAG: SUF system NifU family Fe-S cluster assembly protein [Anaerolineales bacterium]